MLSVMIFDHQSASLADEIFVNGNIFTALFSPSTIFHSTERCFSSRAVAHILYNRQYLQLKLKKGKRVIPVQSSQLPNSPSSARSDEYSP